MQYFNKSIQKFLTLHFLDYSLKKIERIFQKSNMKMIGIYK